jgi:hypothetical protein
LKVISVIFLLLSFSVFSSQSCHSSDAGQKDPRLDLLFALQLQTGYFLNNRYDIPLKAKYKAVKFDTETLTKFRTLTENGFKFSTLPAYFLSLDCELKRTGSAPAAEIRLPADKEKLFADFVSSLEDELGHGLISQLLALPKGFEIDHGLHSSIIKATKDALKTKFDSFPQNISIILHPLLHDGGFFFKVGGNSYSLIGPTSNRGNAVDFGPGGRITEIVAHELSHGFIDQTVYLSDLTECQAFSGEAFRQNMKKNGYVEVKTIITEHMVRAVVLNILQLLEPAYIAQIVQREQDSGYQDLLTLANKFEQEKDLNSMFRQTKQLFNCK